LVSTFIHLLSTISQYKISSQGVIVKSSSSDDEKHQIKLIEEVVWRLNDFMEIIIKDHSSTNEDNKKDESQPIIHQMEEEEEEEQENDNQSENNTPMKEEEEDTNGLEEWDDWDEESSDEEDENNNTQIMNEENSSSSSLNERISIENITFILQNLIQNVIHPLNNSSSLPINENHQNLQQRITCQIERKFGYDERSQYNDESEFLFIEKQDETQMNKNMNEKDDVFNENQEIKKPLTPSLNAILQIWRNLMHEI